MSGVGFGPLVSHQLVCLETVVEAFWELESIGIQDKAHPVLKEFEEQIQLVDSRYEVALPWKPNMKPQLLNNVHVARKRLEGLGRRLQLDPSLKKRYDGVLQELLDKQIVERVPESQLVPQDEARPVYTCLTVQSLRSKL